MPAVSRHVIPAAILLALLPSAAGAKGGAFRDSAHGSRTAGVLRLPGVPRGECAHCHGGPASGRAGGSDGRAHAGLFAPNDNALCTGCHGAPAGAWLGEREYAPGAHASSPGAAWPGPEPKGRPARDAGKCVNCHDPHGVRDAGGVIPDLLRVRGAELCLTCHDGTPAADVATAFSKPFRHPLVTAPRPAPLSGSTGASTTGARAETCAACHNPHAAGEDPTPPRRPDASRALRGVSRVRVVNGLAGSPPVVSPVAAGEPGAFAEHEICFRCHAGTSPAAGIDVAVAFNPANPSFHPVEAPGRNRSIDRRAFVQGWGADHLVACSDCHGSDDEGSRGPHGSRYPRLLALRHVTELSDPQPLDTDLCFRCHAYAVYGDPHGGADLAASRFPGHAAHAGRGHGCWACHESHGSATLPSLLAQRSGGIAAYARDPGGGSCTVSCHLTTPPTASYRVTYPR